MNQIDIFNFSIMSRIDIYHSNINVPFNTISLVLSSAEKSKKLKL